MRALPLLLLMLSACRASSEPEGVTLSFGTYAASPVIITDFRLNGIPVHSFPLLENSEVDQIHPRVGGALYSLPYPSGENAQTLQISAAWVELLTHRAFTADLEVSVGQLQTLGPDQVRMMPVFGPNGLLLITSDPQPGTGMGTDMGTADLARVCGTRAPLADRDFTGAADAMGGLREALGFDYPAVRTPECPALKG